MSNETNTTRRNFMKTSSLAVGAGMLSNLSMASGAYASSDETVKVGLIGVGGRGRGAASQALSTEGNVQLVAVADAFPDRLEEGLSAIKASLGQRADRVQVDEEHKFVGFNAYQQVLNSGIDVVILTTPPGFRPIHFNAAVKAGKNIFCEKPVATDSPGIRLFLAANEEAKKKGLKIGIGLQRHHQYTYLETMKKLKEGAIGDIIAMRCYWNSGGVWEPRRKREECKTEMEYQMRNWYYYNWLCGDHICEQHIHNLDVCNWLKDEHPVKARGMGGREVRKDKRYGEIFDHFAVQYEYADGTPMFSECRHIRNCWNSVSEYAHGSKGICNISGSSYIAGDDKWRYSGKKNNPYQTEHDDLFAAIRNNEEYNEGDYGASSTMTAILGRMATYSGKEVSWDNAFNSEKSIMPDSYTFLSDPPTVPDENGEYPIPTPGVTEVV